LYDKYRQIIEKNGITSYNVSKNTGISQVTLTDWKYGRYVPKVDKLIKIAAFLHIPLEELLSEDTERDKKGV
jgi:transcriptional regulator with XRE-family HTH domain